jgi:hypothetical protein
VCLLMEAKAGVYHKLLFIFIFMAMWLGMYGACRTYMYLEHCHRNQIAQK